MKKIILLLLFSVVVLGISSCAPAAPSAQYNISRYDGYGNYVRDVITVTNEARFPLASGHKVDVLSLVTRDSWVHTFPHVSLEGYHYLLWSDNSWTRVTEEEAQRHVDILESMGYGPSQSTYTYTPDESDSSSDSNTEKCSRCRGTGKTRTFMANEWYEENCATCGGDGSVNTTPIGPTYFLFRR